MRDTPKYIFLKQAAALKSYFGDICLDVPRQDESAVVFSSIKAERIGTVVFETGPAYSRASFKARLISWMRYLAAAVPFAFRVKGQPLLFLIAQPPFLPFLGYLQKKLMGRKYVVWIDDVYPDVLVRKNVIRKGGLVDRLWSAFNRITLKNSEHVFTLGPQMLDVVRQYLPVDFPATGIPTWVDTDVIRPVAKAENDWSKTNGFGDKFVVMYSGNFGDTHELDSLLEAASRLREDDDVRFVLIGAGSQWDSVREAAAAQGHSNIMVLPWQPVEVLSESLSSADVSFVTLATGIEGISMPSKTYYAMAAGTALIASCAEGSDLDAVVRRSECGLTVRPNSVDDVVAAVQNLKSNPEMLNQYKENARRAAVAFYSRRVNVERLQEILERIALS